MNKILWHAVCVLSLSCSACNEKPVSNTNKVEVSAKSSFSKQADSEKIIIASNDAYNKNKEGGEKLQVPLFFNTYNSIRHVSYSKRQTTIHYEEGLNLFGLTAYENGFFSTDHEKGTFQYSFRYPYYRSYNSENNYTELEKATHHTFANDGTIFFASNYNIYKFDGKKLALYSEASLLKAPFSLAINGDFLWITGKNEMAVVNIKNNRSKMIKGHDIVMAGYSCFDTEGGFLITDPGTDAIKKLPADKVRQIEQSVALEQSLPNFPFQIVSEGNMLLDPSQDSKRGPVGIAFAKNVLWVTVDEGTSLPGRIVIVKPGNGKQELYLSDLAGPRAIIIAND